MFRELHALVHGLENFAKMYFVSINYILLYGIGTEKKPSQGRRSKPLFQMNED